MRVRGSVLKRLLVSVLAALLGAALVGGAIAYALYFISGRSPGELLRRAELTVLDRPRLQAIVGPALQLGLAWLGEPTQEEMRAKPHVPALPPNPLQMPDPVSASGTSQRVSEAKSRQGVGRTLRVGPGREFTRPSQAARAARDGDTIEIDAGDYRADSAIWDRADITIRGLGRHVRLIADGASAEGKAIWVFRSRGARVENVQFFGARVGDRNGAGIRFESGSLFVSFCTFIGNQNGLLTANDPNAELEIHNSEFGYNGNGDGRTHQLYAGSISSLKVVGSYFHHANGGHLIKSRAARSLIAYNRLSDESGGRAAYELEFPNGGDATLIGNIIHQGRGTANSTIVSFGAEHFAHGLNALVMSHNTLVNDLRVGGIFVRVYPGAARFDTVNNVFVGPGRIEDGSTRLSRGDAELRLSSLANAARGDYSLRSGEFKPAEVPQASRHDIELIPDREYAHPLRSRELRGAPTRPGAVQN